MTRIMYDALEASGIPEGAEIAAWYPWDSRSDGPPIDAQQVVTIDNTGNYVTSADIMDATDAPYTVADAPHWVDVNAEPYPTIYCNLSDVSELLSAMSGTTKQWWLWIADWDNSTAEPSGIPALPENCLLMGWQYQSTADYDLSVVEADNWFPVQEEDSVSFVNYLDIPGQWIDPRFYYDATSKTVILVGTGTTGHVYMTYSVNGGSWASPITLPPS